MGNQYFADTDEVEQQQQLESQDDVTVVVTPPVSLDSTNPKQPEEKHNSSPLLLDVNDIAEPKSQPLLTKLQQIIEQHPIDENGLDQYMSKQPEELRIGEVAHLLHLYKHLYKVYNQFKTVTKDHSKWNL